MVANHVFIYTHTRMLLTYMCLTYICQTVNSVSVKAVAKGPNKIIKEVSKASKSLIKKHIPLKVENPGGSGERV